MVHFKDVRYVIDFSINGLSTKVAWGSSLTHTTEAKVAWGSSHTHTTEAKVAWGSSHTHTTEATVAWGSSHTHTTETTVAWGSSHTHTTEATVAWGSSHTHTIEAKVTWGSSYTHTNDSPHNMRVANKKENRKFSRLMQTIVRLPPNGSRGSNGSEALSLLASNHSVRWLVGVRLTVERGWRSAMLRKSAVLSQIIAPELLFTAIFQNNNIY